MIIEAAIGLIGLLAALMLIAGVRLQLRADPLIASTFHALREWRLGDESFVVLSVINETSSRDVELAWPRARFHALDGTFLREETARWSDSEQRSKTIRPNGESHSFFLARKRVQDSACFLATSESAIDLQSDRFQLPGEFYVDVTICGVGYESLPYRANVSGGDSPGPFTVAHEGASSCTSRA